MKLGVHGSDGWWVIDDGCYGRINGADVEGDAAEIRQLAEAIKAGAHFSAKRCATRTEGEQVMLWSPRNSISPTFVPRDNALALADLILREVVVSLIEPGGYDDWEPPAEVSP